MKKFILSASILAVLLCMSVIPTTVHAASQTVKAPALTRAPVQWDRGQGGACGSLIKVEISSVIGYGESVCFYMDDPIHTYGYLGMGDSWGPGDIHQAFHLISPLGGYDGWIRYYGGRYPNGTYCRFSVDQYIPFNPFLEVTQIALNVSSSYHQCP